MSVRRIAWKTAAWAVGIVLVLVATALITVRTPWFQDLALRKIVDTIQTATGGRAQMARFQFDPFRLRATIQGLVVRGSEPATEAPFFEAERVVVEARLLSSFTSFVGVSLIDVTRPRVNIIVLSDGTTNIPQRATPEERGKNPLETVVNLAVGKFRITDGYARVLQQSIPFSGEGQNLRVALDFDRLGRRYEGRVDIEALNLARGNERLNVGVAIPVVVGRDSIELNDATLKTPGSQLKLSGSLESLDDPRFRVRGEGQVALKEIVGITGVQMRYAKGAPEVVALYVDAGLGSNGLEVSSARVAMGSSRIEAKGRFQNAAFENGAADITADLALNELMQFWDKPAQVTGQAKVQAQARMRSKGDYTIDGSVTGERLGYRDGELRVSNARLVSTIMADPHTIRFDPVRIDVASGRITARGTLQDVNRYEVNGQLTGFPLQEIFAAVGTRGTAWSAAISGPISAQGELEGQVLRTVRADLSLTPNNRGIPLRGRVTAIYSGQSDSLDVGQSYLILPASRMDFAGAVNRQMTVRVTSRNLNDFRPALALASSNSQQLPVQLEPRGSAVLDATVTGRLSSPVIRGQVQLAQFRIEDRRFDNLSAGFRAAANGAAIENGVLTNGPLQARLNASVGLRQWKADSDQPLTADIAMDNGDLRDVLVLAGQSDVPARGALTLRALASGTVGDPQGSADLHIRNGEVYGEPVESADAQVAFGGTRVTLSSLRVTSNMATAEANGTFDHPMRDFAMGTLRGHVQANQVALSRIQAIQKQRPGLAGLLHLNADVEAALNPPGSAERVTLTTVNGDFGVQGIRYGADDLGNLTADVSTSGREVAFRVNSNFAGSSIRAEGRTRLDPDYPTTATLAIANLPIERVLQVAGRTDIAAKGRFGARGNVSGTIKQPTADLTVELAQAVLEKQAIDELNARVLYQDTLINVPSLEARAGANRISLTASFRHPANDFRHGEVELSARTNDVQLAQVQYVKQQNPGLAGTVQASVAGKGRLDSTRDSFPVDLTAFEAKITAQGLTLNGTNYGGLSFTAEQRGQAVNVKLESDVAKSTIRATAEVRLATNYPVTGEVTLQGVQYSNFEALRGGNDLRDASFDARAEGTIRFSGPALDPRRMTGIAEFATLEAYTVKRTATNARSQQIALRNDGPMRLAVTNAGMEIRQARWTGPSTNVSVAGGVRLEPEMNFNLNVQANGDLSLIQAFDEDIRSGGAVIIAATVSGPLSEPVVRGRIELKDAALQQVRMLNGLSKTNAVIELAGTTARIQSFTAESGGGNVTLSGTLSRTGGLYRFDLQGRTRGVRVQTEAGISVVSNADFRLNGTDKNSLLSGEVNVRMVSFNSRSDIGSILTRVAPPTETPAGTSILDTMRLNITARIGSTTIFRTGFAERLDASADLTVRGTVSRPGILGRLVISEGELIFFGTKYSLNDGVVAFYNPTKIEPILNLNLTTTARGVRVDLSVTGSVSNMNLAYRSDPPLQFSEIVSLLAAGKAPTSDPILVAHQPATPQQTLPQMGASALLSTAVANPVAGQLQRVFGVTQLKIDPTFTSGAELPQARLTVQQQISSDLTFTYITNVTRSDSQIVRVEWAIDDNWSALATRQENGMVGVDLFYKRRFQ